MDKIMEIEKNVSAVFSGVPAAPGMERGPALVLSKETLVIPRETGKSPEKEKSRLALAVQQAAEKIGALADKLKADNLEEEAAVFGAHILLIQDKSLHRRVNQQLDQGINVEAAWADSVETIAGQLESLPDPTLSLRAIDLRDAGEGVLKILLGKNDGVLSIPEPSIIVADDLTPSETVSMDKAMLLGFCTSKGGPTSHTAILAKALGIPAVVSLGDSLQTIETGQILLLNGDTGEVVVSPDAETEAQFAQQANQAQQRAEADMLAAFQPATTLDGFHVEVAANIGNADDASKALELGAEGVGLLRTEFLFLERATSPNEEEQFQVYQQIFDVMGDRPVVVRTLDAGGDKAIPYLNTEPEENPFLGWRAIRLCLSQPEFFKVQLRALLRAGVGHDLRIMFPMIATLQEVRDAKQLLQEARDELLAKGLPAAENIQVGIMVEIPSVAVMADLFAREVDFFSLGTNDLTQYTLAADRTNPKITHLSDYCHPAILRLIQQTTQAAHAAGIWVGVCGEMAGDQEALPLLLAIGLDEVSMSPTLIPRSKRLIRSLDRQALGQILNEAVRLVSAEAVRELVRTHLR